MTRPLRSTGITRLHHYYGAVRTWPAHRYFRPRGVATCAFSLPIADLSSWHTVIEHIVDMDPYLSEIRRVLKPGGIVVFTTSNVTIRLDPGMQPWNQFYVQEFTPPQLGSLLRPFFAEVKVRDLPGSRITAGSDSVVR